MSNEQVNLSLFTHLLARSNEDLDLFEAALMISTLAYPEIDPAPWKAMLDDLGQMAREEIVSTPGSSTSGPITRLRIVLKLLYQELGFKGDETTYFDPRNSFMSDVLTRKLGIPLSLALVILEVAERAGIAARGVSFPGHFLVRCDEPSGFAVIDPFHGVILDASAVQALHERATGQSGPVPPTTLQPASKRLILLRMLHNLRGIYQTRNDSASLEAVQRRMKIVEASSAQRAAAPRPMN